jgi:hypothetical protein
MPRRHSMSKHATFKTPVGASPDTLKQALSHVARAFGVEPSTLEARADDRHSTAEVDAWIVEVAA